MYIGTWVSIGNLVIYRLYILLLHLYHVYIYIYIYRLSFYLHLCTYAEGRCWFAVMGS